jgi:hypothetical protein
MRSSRFVGPTLVAIAIVSSALLWARSRRHVDTILFFTPAGNVQLLGSSDGFVFLLLSSISAGRERGLSLRYDGDDPADLDDARSRITTAAAFSHDLLGFGVMAGRAEDLASHLPGDWCVLHAPHWFLMAIAGATGVVVVMPRVRRHRRIAKGLCPSCGYDIRASPQRCPECGAQFAVAST